MALPEDQHAIKELPAQGTDEVCVPRIPSTALTSRVAIPAA
jgi:hypothetical protein